MRTAHPRVVEAFEPLVEHLAYEFQVERQEDRVTRVADLLGEAGPKLRTAIEKLGGHRLEVQLLDLHGLRAREAKDALRTCTEPLCVVWFGKGRGELREVFLEYLATRADLVLVDMSGETRARPQEAMGVVLRQDLHAKLSDVLTGKKPVETPTPTPTPAPAPAPAPAPTPAPAPSGLFGWLLTILKAILRLFILK